PLTVGGGISTISDIRNLLQIGADKIALNTHAFKNPSLIKKAASAFGAQSIIVAIDARKNKKTNTYEVFINNGKQSTGIEAKKWAQQAAQLGAGELLITSIDRDGTMKGFENELIKEVAATVNVPVI